MIIKTNYDKRIAAWHETVRLVKNRRIGLTRYYDPDIADAMRLIDDMHAELEVLQTQMQVVVRKVGYYVR